MNFVYDSTLMLAVALVISNLTASIRLQARVAGHRERRTAMLYAMSRELAATRATNAFSVGFHAADHRYAAGDGGVGRPRSNYVTDAQYTALVIEDEPQLRRLLRTALETERFRVIESETGQRGIIEAGTHKPDVAIIDLGLPDLDGVRVIERIREWSTMPIIVLSARTQESEKINALDAGADDYVTKPFGVGELFARLRVALRRAARSGASGSTVALWRYRIRNFVGVR